MSRRCIRFAGALLAATMVTLGMLGMPAVAHADPVLGVDCALGTWSTAFSPAATLQPQKVTTTVDFEFTNCVSASNLALHSGTAHLVRAISNFSCLSLLVPVPATYVIHWNTGQSSTITVTNEIVGVAVVATGTVNSGLFAGKTVTMPLVSFPVDVVTACPTNGLSEITGTATLDFT